MTANNYNPFKPPETKAIMILAWLFVLAVLAVLLGGCSTLKKSSQSATIDSTSTHAFNYDSAWNATMEHIKQSLIETEKHYNDSPTVIYVKGEPYIVPTKVTERHFVTEKQTIANNGSTNKSDTGSTTIKKQEEQSTKEKTSVPIWFWFAVCGLCGYLIARVLKKFGL